MDAAPVQLLAYDDLPPGSDIRRERDGDVLRITIPAGEPSAAILKQAWRDALVHAALYSGVFSLAAVIPFLLLLRLHRISGVELIVGWASFGVFCGALVLLLASTIYMAKSQALYVSRRQMTVLAVTPARLLVETTGPFGLISHEVPALMLAGVRVRWGKWQDDRGRSFTLRHLRLHLNEGTWIDILPGRDRAELSFLADAIRTGLRQEVRPA